MQPQRIDNAQRHHGDADGTVGDAVVDRTHEIAHGGVFFGAHGEDAKERKDNTDSGQHQGRGQIAQLHADFRNIRRQEATVACGFGCHRGHA